MSDAQTDKLWDRLRAYGAALETIEAEAPAKEPPNYATVGPMNCNEEFREYVGEMITQAFNEGHTRGCWDMAQIAKSAAVPK